MLRTSRHVTAVAYKLLYEPLTKSMWDGKFRHPVTPKPLNGFRTNLEFITISRMWPNTQIYMALRQRGRSRRIAVCRCQVSLRVFFVLSSRPQVAHAVGPIFVIIMTFFVQGRAFWGSRRYHSPFRGQIPKNLPKGAWIGIFQPNRQQIKMSSYLRSCSSCRDQILHGDEHRQSAL